MPLSDRENFLRNVEMTGPDWTPCCLSISGATWNQLGAELEDVLLRHPVLFPGYEKGKREFREPDEYGLIGIDETHTDAWGCVWQQSIDGIAGIVIEEPLDDWAKFDGYQPPDPLVQGDRGEVDWEQRRNNIAKAKSEGRLTSGSTSHGFLFMRLYYLRGFDNFMMDVATEEPRLRALIQLLVDHNMKIVQQYLEMGVDVMDFADDLGTQTASMVSPADFRKWILPAYKSLMQPCREAGCHVSLHSDGHTLELMDQLIEAGVTIVNPQDLCHGIDNLARELKGRVCIRLDIDRQSIVPFGTPREIRDHIEEAVRKLGSPDGGLEMIAGIYPPTPAENIDALCSAFEEFRTYWSGR